MKSYVVLAFVLLFLLTVIFFSFTLLQFDPNELRPQIQHYLGETFHAEVALAPVSMQWGIHPTIQASGIQILQPDSKQVLLKAGMVRARVKLFALFGKRMQIESLEFVSPEIYFFRRADESWNWNGFGEVESSSGAASVKEKWEIIVRSLVATDADIYYRDEAGQSHFGFTLSDARFTVTRAQIPASHVIQFEMPAAKRMLTGSINLNMATETFEIQMEIKDRLAAETKVESFAHSMRFSTKGKVMDLPLQDLVPESSIQGLLSGEWKGEGEGYTLDTWWRTLILNANFQINQGQLLFLNFPKSALQQLALIPIPSLATLTQMEYPQGFDQVLQGSVTPFEEWKGNLQMSEGKFFMEEFHLQNAAYSMDLSGYFNHADQYTNLRGSIAFSPEVSEVMMRTIPFLETFGTQRSELVLPIEYGGRLPETALHLDMTFVVNRLVQTRGEELYSLGIPRLNEFMEVYQ